MVTQSLDQLSLWFQRGPEQPQMEDMGRELRGEAKLLCAGVRDWRIIRTYTVEELPSVPW